MPIFARTLGDYREYADRPSFDVSTAFSVALWTQPIVVTAGARLVSRGTTAAEGEWVITVAAGGALTVTVFTSAAKYSVNGSTVLVAGKFYHVAFTFSSVANELRLYVDGALDASAVVTSGTMPAIALPVRLFELTTGAGHHNAVQAFFGLWSAALSAAEVTQLYAGIPASAVQSGAGVIADVLEVDSADVAGGVSGTNAGTLLDSPPWSATATDAPTPAPEGHVSSHASTSFIVTVTAVSGEALTTLRLQTRTLGSSDAWTTQASDATPAVGDTLTASGLTTGTALEWRLVEEDAAGNQADGTHGITTPATPLWPTLTATIATALEGQGMLAASIYTGTQPEANYPTPCAILRTRPERVRRRANNVEAVEFPVHVEIRAIDTTDDGGTLKTAGNLWQRRLEAALHEKHAGDFPGIAGLEEITVEVDDKDGRGLEDEYHDEIRTRAVVRFLVWRAK